MSLYQLWGLGPTETYLSSKSIFASTCKPESLGFGESYKRAVLVNSFKDRHNLDTLNKDACS